ncbi:MAG TPA: hypothetical protein DEB70_11315 [Planctomycetaceae bacterium]|nr:hypothetical protein [Planctomycetaceae bacterium]
MQSLFSSATVWSSHADRFPSFHSFLGLRQKVLVVGKLRRIWLTTISMSMSRSHSVNPIALPKKQALFAQIVHSLGRLLALAKVGDVPCFEGVA